ncbi:MAG: hypothetical protein ACO1O1_02880 [Adhaeribacter sp.]
MLWIWMLLPAFSAFASGKDKGKDKCRDAIKVSCSRKDHKHNHKDRCEEYEPICSEQKWVKLEFSCQNGKGGWWSHNGKGRFDEANNTYHATEEEINAEAQIDITYTSYDRNGGRKYDKCDKHQQKYRIKCRKSHDKCKHKDPCRWFHVDVKVYQPSCFGGSDGRIDISTAGGAAPYKFIWESDHLSHPQYTPDLYHVKSGWYTLKVIDWKKCVLVKKVYVPQPKPIVVVCVIKLPTNGNGPAVATVEASDGVAPYKYEFKCLKPGTNYSVENNILKCYGNAVFEVWVTDRRGCVYKKIIIIKFPDNNIPTLAESTTAARLDPDQALKVYPNVMREEATLEFTLEKASTYTLDLYDQAGRRVKQISVGQAKAGEKRQFRLDGSSLKPGTYYGKLITSDASRTLRIRKE